MTSRQLLHHLRKSILILPHQQRYTHLRYLHQATSFPSLSSSRCLFNTSSPCGLSRGLLSRSSRSGSNSSNTCRIIHHAILSVHHQQRLYHDVQKSVTRTCRNIASSGQNKRPRQKHQRQKIMIQCFINLQDSHAHFQSIRTFSTVNNQNANDNNNNKSSQEPQMQTQQKQQQEYLKAPPLIKGGGGGGGGGGGDPFESTRLNQNPTLDTETQSILSTTLGQFTPYTVQQSLEILNSYLHSANSNNIMTNTKTDTMNSNDNQHENHNNSNIIKAIQLYNRILEEYKEGNPSILSSSSSSSSSSSNHPNFDITNPSLLKKILQKLIIHHPKTCIQQTHSIITKLKECHVYDEYNLPYNLIIGVLSRCHRLDAAKYSTHLLQTVLDLNNNDLMTKDGRFSYYSSSRSSSGSNSSTNCHYNHNNHYHNHDDHNDFNNKIANLVIADTVTFNSIISLWMNIASFEPSAGDEAMRILNRMKGSYRLGNVNVKPSRLSFSMTITALLKCNGYNAAYHAEEILQDMIYFYQNENGNNNNNGSGSDCGDVDISVNIKDNSSSGKQKSHNQVSGSNDRFIRGDDDISMKPDKGNFDTILNALGKSIPHSSGKINNSNGDSKHNNSNKNALDRAFQLLRQMKELGIKPDTLTYNSVIAIILRTKSKHDAVEWIESVIRLMEEDYTSWNNLNAQPTTMTYNSLIKAYANIYDGKSAENILRKMIKDSDNGNIQVRPDTITWNSVLEAHAKSKSRNSVKHATRILHEMSSYSYSQPDKVTMSLMLVALIRSTNRGDRHAGRQAMLILEGMEAKYKEGNELLKPDLFTYTQIISFIAKCGGKDAYSMAMDVLHKMKILRKEGRDDLVPDTATLNAVLLSITKSKDAATAEEFLNKMQKSDDPSTAPNSTSFSIVITAWAKSKDVNRIERAMKLLKFMEREDNPLKPNTVVYSSVLEVLAKSKDPKAVEKCLEILDRMEKTYVNDENVRPNAYTFGNIMDAIANSNNTDLIESQAQSLLTRLIAAPPKQNDQSSYTIVFNNAIKAIEKSSEQNKATLAANILKLMKTVNDTGKMKAIPTIRTYNAAIRCCAFTSGTEEEKQAAFDQAIDFLTELRANDNIHPDAYTYPALFKACELLLGHKDEDYKALKILFYLCCEDGLVCGLVHTNLKNYLPSKVLNTITGKFLFFRSLPDECSRNVDQNNKKNKNDKRKKSNNKT